MYGLIAGALGALFVIAFAGVALLWGFAVEHPLWALFGIPSAIGALYWFGRREQLRAAAVLDARLRDEHVPSMSPREYEQFTARELERAGWSVTHCGTTGDQGCDVLAELRGFRAVVQCKLYRNHRAGNAAVQEAVAARRHYAAQIMVVVAPCGFTPSAVALATSNGVHLLHHSTLATLAMAARIP